MARIQTYPLDGDLDGADMLVGTDGTPGVDLNKTKNFTLSDLRHFILSGSNYKVFTALLTQSGGDNNQDIGSGPLAKGVSYFVSDFAQSTNYDFSNLGGPKYPENFTNFIATATGLPNSWGTSPTIGYVELNYNTGAPVVTVLENTIGNIWFTYNGVGNYSCNSNGLFIIDKSLSIIGTPSEGVQNNNFAGVNFGSDNQFYINVVEGDGIDDLLNKTPIEIRVYN